MWASTAAADEGSKRTCATAFSGAQRLMRAGNLIEARNLLVLCGGPQCPEVMHPDCQQWLSSVEASMPTVVFHVSSATGTQPKEVHLSIDGGESASLDGRAISINPGPHEVSIGASGFQTATKRFVVTEGEKLRREAVTLAPLHEVHPIDHPLPHAKDTSANIRNGETGGRRITTSVIVATSAAALAGIGAVYLGVKARSDDRNLDSCAATSSCTREAVDQVRHEYIWTNVSIGVAIAGIATAVVLYLVSDRPGKRTGKRTNTTAFGIGGAPDGVSSVVTGRF